jgi:hypothetical protein
LMRSILTHNPISILVNLVGDNLAYIPNGVPHLELSVNQKMVENALNRFLTSVQVTNDIDFSVMNLEFLPRGSGDSLNTVHVKFNLGISGVALDDWAELKLFLDGSRGEKLRVDYVDRKKNCFFDIINELKMGLIYVDLMKPVILELPTALEGKQVRYYLKASGGNLIMAATYLGRYTVFNEAMFHVQYSGCITSDERFGFAVNHRVIKQVLVEAVNGFESGDMRLHDISEGDIFFMDDRVKISGGLTSEAPCGPGTVDLDLDYSVEAEFLNNGGDLDVMVNFGVSFASLGERATAAGCGVLEAIESRRLYLPFVALAVPVLTMIGFSVAEDMANSMADQRLSLYDYRETGIGFRKEGERRWRVMLRPVAALKEWGGLLWPMRLTRIDLNAGGRVFITGDQDVEPNQSGVQEADFAGGFEVKWGHSFYIKYNLVGSPEGIDEAVFRLVKDDEALIGVVGWEVVDDAHRCFSVSSPPSILSGLGIPGSEGETELGSMVLSPQNEIRVGVTFGPDFYKFVNMGDGGEGYWLKYTPGPGESFTAKIKVTYITKGENGRWQVRDAYIDLNGCVSLSMGMDAPNVSGIHDAFHVMPDEILEIGEELQADWGLWDDLPRTTDFEYFEVACTQKAVKEVAVVDQRGGVVGRGFDADVKVLGFLSNPKQSYTVTSSTGEGVKGGRFMVQRVCYAHRHTLSPGEPIQGYAYKGNLLAVNTGAEVTLYDLKDVGNPVKLGYTRFKSCVNHLSATMIDGRPGFIASDDAVFRLIGAPETGKRSIVKQQRKMSALRGVKALALHGDKVYGVSETGVSALGRQPRVSASLRGAQPVRVKAVNFEAEEALFSGDWVFARSGSKLSVRRAPWLGGDLLGSVRVQPGSEFRVRGLGVYVFDGEGKTRVVSLRDPSHPVVVAEYRESKRGWGVRRVGQRAFEVDASGKSLLIYRRKPRRVNVRRLNEDVLSRLRG